MVDVLLALVPAQLCPGFGQSHVVKINGGEVRVEGVGFGIKRFRRPHEPDQKSLSALDDALIVVASESGGLVPCQAGDRSMPDGTPAIWALSWAEVDAIRERLNRLNPYERTAVPDLFKLEGENYDRTGTTRVELRCVAIGPKRYALAEIAKDGTTDIRRASRHGLGYFMAPTERPTFEEADEPADHNWSEVVWRRIVDEVRGRDPGPEPAWFSNLAPSRDSISRWNALAPYRHMNLRRRYARRIKPANFLLVAHDDPLIALPRGMDRAELTPIAPFSREPSAWLTLPWRNRFDGTRLSLTTKRAGEAGRIRVRTYGDIVTDYRLHPDPKTGAPDGGPVLRGTVGVLVRRPIRVTGIRYVGKETARRIDEESGLLRVGDAPHAEFRDDREEWSDVRAALIRLCDTGRLTVARLAEISGLSERSIQYALNRGSRPRSRTVREALRLEARRHIV